MTINRIDNTQGKILQFPKRETKKTPEAPQVKSFDNIPTSIYSIDYVKAYNGNVVVINPYKNKIVKLFKELDIDIDDESIKKGFDNYCTNCKDVKKQAQIAKGYAREFLDVLSSVRFRKLNLRNLEDVFDDYLILLDGDDKEKNELDDSDVVKFSNFIVKIVKTIQNNTPYRFEASTITTPQGNEILDYIYISDEKKNFSIRIDAIDFYYSMEEPYGDLSGNYAVFFQDDECAYSYENDGEMVSKINKDTNAAYSSIATNDVDEKGNPLFYLDEFAEHGVMYSILSEYCKKDGTSSMDYTMKNIDDIDDD